MLVTRRVPATVRSLLAEACEVDLWTGEEPMPRQVLLDRLASAQAVICVLTDRMDAEAVNGARGLRVIANIAVGYDNIDVAHARSRGVVVTNTPDVLTESVAEFTWGLILAVTRRIPEGDRLIRRDEWKGWALDFMLGAELTGKRLGIVGSGRIGRAVAARGSARGMHVVYAARTDSSSDDERVSLDHLLSTSDVISLHVPLTTDTRHLLDHARLARMKRSAYLINTSRGAVIDEAALAWALEERLIAGAALDVYEAEPKVQSTLVGLDNVVLTPHLGSATRETRTAMAELAARNVMAVLSGGSPLTPILG